MKFPIDKQTFEFYGVGKDFVATSLTDCATVIPLSSKECVLRLISIGIELIDTKFNKHCKK